MRLKEEFLAMLRAQLPHDCEPLAQVLACTEPQVSVRVNAAKHAAAPQDAERVPWCDLGFYCASRPAFTFDTDWHAGRYYVQDASSMFLHHVISCLVKEPVRYLDLCAAPGGKTTAALGALPEGSLLVANEVVPNRARILTDNVLRWGNPHVAVTSNLPDQWAGLTHFFDVVAADVPCSGEGMMRKDDEAVAQWSPALVEKCAQRQRAIVAEVWPALKPGGLLIYSTCTFNRQENEEIVDYIVRTLGARPVAVPVDERWGIMPAVGADFPAYRFLPHRVRGEGLFVAVLQKAEGAAKPFKIKLKQEKVLSAASQAAQQWLKEPCELTMQDEVALALPRRHAAALRSLKTSMNVLSMGVPYGIVKGKNVVPRWSLAFSELLSRDAFVSQELTYEASMAFLRGEAISVTAPRGYVLVTHRNVSLGLVNHLGNRANNLYSKQLRILSSHFPEVEPLVVS